MKLFFFSFFSSLCVSISAQSNYVINLHLSDAGKNKVYLLKTVDGNDIMDSLDVPATGNVVFKGNAQGGIMAQLVVLDRTIIIKVPKGNGSYVPPPFLSVFLFNDTVDIVGSTKNLWAAKVVPKHATASERAYYDSLRLQNINFFTRLSEHSNDTSDVVFNKLLDDLSSAQGDFTENFIKNNPSSKVAFLEFDKMSMMQMITLPKKEAMFKAFSPNIKATKVAQDYAAKLKIEKSTSKGGTAPLFSATTLGNKNFSLAQWKGKYVLVDFWATWCGPCMEGNPHMVELYNKYHSKGLEIVGIANETQKGDNAKKLTNLNKVISDNNMVWPQILNNPQNKICSKYAVAAYPTKILLGKDGKILLRVNTESIDEELAKIFK